MDEPLYHITFASAWADAGDAGEYRMSTRGATLDDVGFIHTSYRHQVERVGAFVFGDAVDELVVLVIDPARVAAPIVVENVEGGTEAFPHIYGPLPIDAVVDVLPARIDEHGQLVV